MLEDVLYLTPTKRLVNHYCYSSRSKGAEEGGSRLGASGQENSHPILGLHSRQRQHLGDRARPGAEISIPDAPPSINSSCFVPHRHGRLKNRVCQVSEGGPLYKSGEHANLLLLSALPQTHANRCSCRKCYLAPWSLLGSFHSSHNIV